MKARAKLTVREALQQLADAVHLADRGLLPGDDSQDVQLAGAEWARLRALAEQARKALGEGRP
jgi:hypothetical protein